MPFPEHVIDLNADVCPCIKIDYSLSNLNLEAKICKATHQAY
jgi:hypothetical protein